MIKSSLFKSVPSIPFLISSSPHYFSESSKPENHDKQKPEVKKTLGSRYAHPFKKMIMMKTNNVMAKRATKIKMKMLIKQTSAYKLKELLINLRNPMTDQKRMKQEQQKEKEKEKEKEKQENQKYEFKPKAFMTNWIKISFTLAVLLSIFLPDNAQITQQQTTFQSNTKAKSIISTIEKLPEPVHLIIYKKRDEDNLPKIQIYNQNTKIKTNHFIGTIPFEMLPKFLQTLQGPLGHKYISVSFKYRSNLKSLIDSNYIKIGVQLFIFFLLYRFIKWRTNILSPMSQSFQKMMGGQKFKPIKPDNINIYFKDVAGLHEAKVQVTQFVDFLKIPEKYIEMGAKVPKGALLTGPPGTGKTLLAKACAGQAGVPFYYVSGSDFIQKYSGLGASRVRGLFNEAEKNSPSIIFIDQIDAIGKKRDSGPFSNEERDNTLNQLLVRMDGFDTQNKVIVMAATNRKDMLDPALLRPGRFDRTIQIGVPNFQERKQILKVHLKKVKYDSSLKEDEIAKKISVLTPGFSGAQLANVCNEAAILAARQNKPQITVPLFEKATQRVMAGLEKRNLFSDEERQILSFYECGKAVTSWFTQGSDPIIKISILPFSKSGKGYSHSIKDETSLNTKNQLLAKACCYLAGRAAQNHFKGFITTNGDNDLQRAKRIISLIVTKFGMSDSLKMIAFPDIEFTRKPYSQKIQALIDEEITKLTQQCQNKVELIIKEKQSQILILKEQLLKKQTLTHQCIKQILGDRPAGSNQNYEIFVKEEESEERKKEGPISGVDAQYKRV